MPIEIYGPQEVEAIARAADIATTAQVAAFDALRRGEDVREQDGPRRLGSPSEAVLPVLAEGWPRRGWLARLLGR